MLLVLAAPSAACAQSAISDLPDSSSIFDISSVPSHHRYREISFYSGQSFANPQLMSDLSGQHLFFSGVRTTSRLFTTPQLFIGGNLDLKPLAIYSLNRPVGTEYTYGGGGSIGLQFAPRTHWRWQPFFDVDGGLLCFPHDVPLPNTRRVSMALDFGPGTLIPLRENNALRTGIWFFHFSDGNTAPRNPGFDGVMFYVSYTYRNFAPHVHKHFS
jgi:Lipid A 3-O-deacylase (PagL)